MNLIIKILENKDLAKMKAVLEDDNIIFDIKKLKSFINDDKSVGFIAQVDDEVVGFAYGYKLLRPDGKTMFHVYSIGILSTYQNHGIGTQLMECIVGFAKNNKCSEIFIITEKTNPRACHVYEKTDGVNEHADEIVYVYDLEKND